MLQKTHNYNSIYYDLLMRYYITFISYLLFNGLLVSCGSSNLPDTTDSTTTLPATGTAQVSREDSGHCNYKPIPGDSLSMLPAVAGNSPVILFKQADTTSDVLHEIPFRSACLIFTSDLQEMRSVLRCIHDSCIGYVRRKDLFQTFPSAAQPEKQYIVWRPSHDSVRIYRINTKSRRIEDQLSIENSGMYISASLLNAESWTETSAVIEVEMNPAACDATRMEYIIDYKDKLKSLTTTSSYAEEGSSWSSYLVFKKGLLLHVVKTEKWQDTEDENDPVHEKTEITELQWNGDSLEFVGTNILSGN
jgi:hypothetical protein